MIPSEIKKEMTYLSMTTSLEVTMSFCNHMEIHMDLFCLHQLCQSRRESLEYAVVCCRFFLLAIGDFSFRLVSVKFLHVSSSQSTSWGKR